MTVVGAAGGIGQPLALLLKMNPNVAKLSLYDIVHTPGVRQSSCLCRSNLTWTIYLRLLPIFLTYARELRSPLIWDHRSWKQRYTTLTLLSFLQESPANRVRIDICSTVQQYLILARCIPGMTRDDLFNTNAGIVRDIAEVAAKECPKAFLCIITNPVRLKNVEHGPIFIIRYPSGQLYCPNRFWSLQEAQRLRPETYFRCHHIGLGPSSYVYFWSQGNRKLSSCEWISAMNLFNFSIWIRPAPFAEWLEVMLEPQLSRSFLKRNRTWRFLRITWNSLLNESRKPERKWSRPRLERYRNIIILIVFSDFRWLL